MCAGSDTSEGREVYVLHDDILQKWLISEPGQETVSAVMSLVQILLSTWCVEQDSNIVKKATKKLSSKNEVYHGKWERHDSRNIPEDGL